MKTKRRIGKQSFNFQAFEDLFDYEIMVEIPIDGQKVGAFLLKKPENSPYTLIFGFESLGIHSYLSDEKFQNTFEQIEASLKDFPGQITFHLSAVDDCQDRLDEIERLQQTTDCEALKFILESNKAHTQKLARKRLREPKKLYIFVAYRENQTYTAQDKLDIWGKKLKEVWRFLQTGQNVKNHQRLSLFIQRAAKEGFIYWKQLLELQMKLVIKPLNPIQMWDYLKKPFKCSHPEIPQLLQLKGDRLVLQQNHDYHAVSLLGYPTPEFGRDYVKIGHEYLAFLSFMEKPENLRWNSPREQFHYFWDLVALEQVTNVDVYTQLVHADRKQAAWALRQVTQRAANLVKFQSDRNKKDVLSRLQSERGEQAQEKIFTGNIPFWVSVLIVVRRSTQEDLETACSYIERRFTYPATVWTERQIAWYWWTQSTMLVDQPLLMKPSIQRRMMLYSDEVMGFLPIVKTHEADRGGLELIADDGGTPIHLDLTNPRRHTNIFGLGITRSGKSVLISDIFTYCLSNNVSVMGIDVPTESGESTFSDYTRFLGEGFGTYLDVSQYSINIFDRPYLKHFDPVTQEKRYSAFIENRAEILTTRIVERGQNDILREMIKSIISQTIKHFYDDSQIVENFERAEAGGIGSQVWEERSPTLETFNDYFLKLVNEQFFKEDNRTSGYSYLSQAIEIIKVKLQGLLDSIIGKCIARPTNVQANSLLFIMALTNVGSPDDIATLTAILFAYIMSRSLQHETSVVLFDELPILTRFPYLISLIASLCSNGAKAGIRVILLAQEPNTLLNHPSSSQIVDNIDTWLIGRISDKKMTRQTYLEKVGVDETLLRKVIEFPKAGQYGYSKWLLMRDGLSTICRYYPSPIQLALVVNNPHERQVRHWFYEAYMDKFEAIFRFAQAYSYANASEIPLEEAAFLYLPTHFQVTQHLNLVA